MEDLKMLSNLLQEQHMEIAVHIAKQISATIGINLEQKIRVAYAFEGTYTRYV
jgi:hypothetical protein